MPKFQMQELIGSTLKTARLAEGTDAANQTPATQVANNHSDKELSKPVKLVGDSRFGLCAVGDQIEGFVGSVETGTVDGYAYGGVLSDLGDRKAVTFDGLQATPGTGTIAVGDFVVAGTVVAKGTALSAPPRVCKATTQTGMYFSWRVVSLGSAGSGAVGTTGVIERV